MINEDKGLLGFYRGVVEDNKDPEKRGRCRIRIWGLHTELKEKKEDEGIPVNELPWAEPVMPIAGGISGFGIFATPLQGSHVMCFFENGNLFQLRYFGVLPGFPRIKPDISKGFCDPDGQFPTVARLGEPDWNKKATEKYPNDFVIATPAGIIELDSTPGQETITIIHNSGDFIKIDTDGTLTINSRKRIETVSGSHNETAMSKDTKVQNTLSMKGTTITVTGTTVTISGSATVDIKGGIINLN